MLMDLFDFAFGFPGYFVVTLVFATALGLLVGVRFDDWAKKDDDDAFLLVIPLSAAVWPVAPVWLAIVLGHCIAKRRRIPEARTVSKEEP